MCFGLQLGSGARGKSSTAKENRDNAARALRQSVWVLRANALFQQKCCRRCYIQSKAMAGGESSTLGMAEEAMGCFQK